MRGRAVPRGITREFEHHGHWRGTKIIRTVVVLLRACPRAGRRQIEPHEPSGHPIPLGLARKGGIEGTRGPVRLAIPLPDPPELRLEADSPMQGDGDRVTRHARHDGR